MGGQYAVRVAGQLGPGQVDRRQAGWPDWCSLFLTAKGEPRADTGYVNKKLADTLPDLLPQFRNEAARIVRMEDARRALLLARVSGALATLAGPVAQGYQQRKEAGGLVDYNDLIDRTRNRVSSETLAERIKRMQLALERAAG